MPYRVVPSLAAGGKATGSRLALSVAAGVWFGVSGEGEDASAPPGVASSTGGTSASETVTGGGMSFLASASLSPGSEVVTGGGGAAAGLGSAFSTGFGSAAATVTGAGFSAGLASAGLTTGVGFSGGGGGVIAGAAATTSGFLAGVTGAAAAAAGSGGGAEAGLGGAVEASGPPFLSLGLMRALRSATCCDRSRIACLISASSLSRASSNSETWSELGEAVVEPVRAEVASPSDAVWRPKAVGLANSVKR